MGGGGSMMLAHGFDGKSQDLDAVPTNSDFQELAPYMSRVAKELSLAPDWINPYFQAFTIYLPQDSAQRMTSVYDGPSLSVLSLGAEDVLIMKLMALRSKDLKHIRHLLSLRGVDLDKVEGRLEELVKLFPKEARAALDALDDLRGAHGR
jgi:hypothetical protein